MALHSALTKLQGTIVYRSASSQVWKEFNGKKIMSNSAKQRH